MFKIYAPVDCEIKNITESTDEAFSTKMLGDGILIIPKNGDFYSPFEKAKISMIFDTRHAIYFELSENIKSLMHIGLDTVKLKGEPFKILKNIDENVTNNDKVITANLDLILKNNLSIETPIVFEVDDKFNIKITLVKKIAKRGDLIATVELVEKTKIKNNEKVDDLKIAIMKNKYENTAEEIYEILGNGDNYGEIYNCMTRFRTVVKDTKLINLDLLKKIKMVKGAQFQGNELQIIIGGEVVKIAENYKIIQNKIKNNGTMQKITKQKVPVFKKILMVITGVISPILGILIAAGLFAGLYSVFLQVGWVQSVGDLSQVSQVDMFSGIMFVLYKFILGMIGMFFLISIVRFFDGNIFLALAVGLGLLSRGWIPISEGITDSSLAGFGDWISYGGKAGFLLFNLGNVPIVVGAYESAVLPFAAAAAIVIFMDKWVSTWISPMIDTIFRPFLVIFTALFGTWFLMGPIMGLFEFGILQIFTYIEMIPFGIGVGIYAMLWQPLVLTGAHIVVSTPIDLNVIAHHPSIMYPAYNIAIFTQVGAVIALSIQTRNSTYRRSCLSSIIGGLFGVSEPIIYGITLPRFRPFVVAAITAFPIGMFSGILGLSLDNLGGWGIFEIVGYATFYKQGLIIMIWVISILSGVLTGLIFCREIKNEHKQFKHVIRLINKMFKLDSKEEYKINNIKLKEIFSDELFWIRKNQIEYKKINRYFGSITKEEVKLLLMEEKETKIRERMFKNLNKLKNKIDSNVQEDERLINKFKTINLKYNSFNLNEEKIKIENRINEIQQTNLTFVNSLKSEKETILLSMENKLNDIKEIQDNKDLSLIKNRMFNGIYSVEILYEIIDKKAE